MPARMLSRKDTAKLSGVGAPTRKKVCTDIPCLLLFAACIGTLGYITFLALQPPSDLRRVLHGLDSQHDLCGVDNSVEATGMPLVVTVTLNRPSVWLKLWPFGGQMRGSPRNITLRRGGRDHTSRPLLYYTFPTAGPIVGLPTEAVCVSQHA